jgi:hypothetical protein
MPKLPQISSIVFSFDKLVGISATNMMVIGHVRGYQDLAFAWLAVITG